MKKGFLVIVCSIIMVLFSLFYLDYNKNDMVLESLNYEDIADKLIRFHVLANSDSKEDQDLKLRVRDKVIDEINSKLEGIDDLDEARIILKNNLDNINNVAKKVIAENGSDYKVISELSNVNFPDKVYGEYVFPQGNYEAVRVVIGDGQGQNWWCVMFPQLCFGDETKNNIDNEELSNDIKNIENENEVVFKFKIFDIIENILN